MFPFDFRCLLIKVEKNMALFFHKLKKYTYVIFKLRKELINFIKYISIFKIIFAYCGPFAFFQRHLCIYFNAVSSDFMDKISTNFENIKSLKRHKLCFENAFCHAHYLHDAGA